MKKNLWVIIIVVIALLLLGIIYRNRIKTWFLPTGNPSERPLQY